MKTYNEINKIFNNKNKYIFLISIFIFVIELLLGIGLYFYQYNEQILKKDYSSRLLTIVSTDENLYERINKIDGVESVYPKWVNCYVKDKYENTYVFNYIDNDTLDIIKGKNIFMLDKDEVIVPNTSALEIKDKIEFFYNDKEYTFTVEGIYDNSLGLDYFLVNDVTLEEISYQIEDRYQIVVDDYEHIEKVMEELNKENFDVNVDNVKNLDLLNKNQKIISILISFLVFLLFFMIGIILIVINDILYENQKNIAIMKVCGYKNKAIMYFILLHIVKMISCSIFKATICFLILCLITHLFVGISLSLIFIFCIGVFMYILLLFISLILVLYLLNKIKRLSVILLYKD